MQPTLLDNTHLLDRLDLPDAEIDFAPAFCSQADADRLFAAILETTAWKQDSIRLYGRSIPMPRLTTWYGDPGASYTYSGILNIPLPWTPPLMEVKRKVEATLGLQFNSVLLNRYRDGRDSVSWHSDDEREFGTDPAIASVSLGATRTFQLRHKKRKELKASLELPHGSLLIMRGGTQRHWLHQVPKTSRAVGERINLTFRKIRVV